MKASTLLAGKTYISAAGRRIFIYPSSKVPDACGPCAREAGVPYRSILELSGIPVTVHGWLPADYELYPLEVE